MCSVKLATGFQGPQLQVPNNQPVANNQHFELVCREIFEGPSVHVFAAIVEALTELLYISNKDDSMP